MASKGFTEEDLQSYLDGSFSGSKEDLELFLEQNPDARKSLEVYKQLFLQFSRTQPVDMPASLTKNVLASIRAKQAGREIKTEKYLTVGLAWILLAGILIAGKMSSHFQLPSYDTTAGAFAVILLGLMVWLFARVEIEEKKKIFS